MRSSTYEFIERSKLFEGDCYDDRDKSKRNTNRRDRKFLKTKHRQIN